MTNYKLSDFGRLALEFEEGESDKPYRDLAGHWTIGKGHKLLPHESHKNMKKSEIDKLFDKDIADREGELNYRIGLTLSYLPLIQHKFDAIFILSFNIGVYNFFNSYLYTIIKASGANKIITLEKDWKKYWKQWNKITDPETGKKRVSKGLVSRRAREINLFCNDLKNIDDYKQCLTSTK